MHQNGFTFEKILLLMTVLALSACSLTGRAAVDGPGREEAIIVFLTGEVEIGQGKDWKTAEAGDLLKEGSSIRVPGSAYCEIQIGNKALICIEENTVLEIDSLHDRKTGTLVDLSLTKGTVACKVSRLFDKESFRIRTATTVVGVRGTRFLVSTLSGDSTVVAVGDGTVQVSPRLEIPELYTLAVDSETKTFLEKMAGDFPLIQAGEEILVNSETIHRATLSFNSLKTLLQDKGITDPTRRAELEQAAAALTGFSTKQPLDDLYREKLDQLEAVPFRNFEAADSRKPVKVSLKGNPGSEIIVDGRVVGNGTVSFLIPAGTVLKTDARLPGYKSVEKEMTVTVSGPNSHTFSMEKIPEKRFFIVTEPTFAEIWMDGKMVGTGTYEGILSGGDHGLALVSAPGYNNRWVQILFDDNNGETIAVKLDPVVTSVYKASGSSITGLAVWQNYLIFGDFNGTQSALRSDGEKVWSVRTGNHALGEFAAERSTPVISGNSVAFSGMDELVIINPVNGDLKFRRKLEPVEQHTMNRHPVDAKGTLVYPTNNGFLLVDSETGATLRTIEVPDGTKMTPLYFNGKIYVVNQEGIVFIYSGKGNAMGELKTAASRPMALSIAVSGSRGYFADKDGHLVCLDLASDRILWENDIEKGESWPVSEDLAVADNVLVAWSRGALYGFAADTGKRLWSTEDDFSAPPLITGGFIYAGTTDGKIAVLTARNGVIYQSADLDQRTTTRPVLFKGSIWFGTDGGNIIVIRPAENRTAW